MMTAHDFITDVIKLIVNTHNQLPLEAEQYADEDLRMLFGHINILFAHSCQYEKELEENRNILFDNNVEKILKGVQDERTIKMGTRDTHVGVSDYSNKKIQPWDMWIEYGLNPWDADIIKRILRTKDDITVGPKESRILDYQKIQHICQERIDQIRKGDPYYQNLTIPPWVDKSND